MTLARWSWIALAAVCAACAERPLPALQPLHELVAIDGTRVSLDDYAGRVLLVDVWASWCAPCAQALPFYRELAQELGDRGLSVLAIDVDRDEAAMRAFLAREPLPFPVIHDPSGALAEALGVSAMPTSLLVDRAGVARSRREGFSPADREALRAQVLALLAEPVPLVSAERELMGTLVRVQLASPRGPAADAAIDACFAAFEHVDLTMSEWRSDSAVSELNRRAGAGPVPVPADLFAVLESAQRVSVLSRGAFDVTWAALRDLWRFDETAAVPDPAAVAARQALVGYHDLLLDPVRRTAELRRAGMAAGLGGIAKGWALRVAADELRGRGYHDFLLDAGGQVYAAGRKGGRSWSIGVRDPWGERSDFFAILELDGASVSTSGDYEHAFVAGGARYHHILDPHTGYPARGVRSATVIASDPVLADAFSTACFVLGSARALALAAEQGFELLLVDEQGTLAATPELRRRLRLVHPPGH